MTFVQNDIARDDTGGFHVFVTIQGQDTLGTIRYGYEEVDEEAPWRSGRASVKFVTDPNLDKLTLCGKQFLGNVVIANIDGDNQFDHLSRSLAGHQKLNLVTMGCPADVDLNAIGASMPFECRVNTGQLAMHHPKVFEILKPYLKGSRFILDDELYTLLKLSI